MVEVEDFVDGERVLARVTLEFGDFLSVKHFMKVEKVGVGMCGINDDIIYVTPCVGKGFIHHALEFCESIALSNWHKLPLVAMGSPPKGTAVGMSGLDGDGVKALAHVHGDENAGVIHAIEDFLQYN